MDASPKDNKLGDVLHGEAFGGVDIGDPKIVYDAFVDREIFPRGKGEDGRSNVLRFHPIQPWRMSKICNATIPKRDSCSRIEEIHVLLATRVLATDPRLCRFLPLHPWPTKTQGSREFV